MEMWLETVIGEPWLGCRRVGWHASSGMWRYTIYGMCSFVSRHMCGALSKL